MIDFIHVSKHFGTQDILTDVSFRINPGERVGIVGPNGAGKSTIFSLITGEISCDGGSVSLPRHLRLGHLHQQLRPYAVGDTVLEYAENAVPELHDIERELTALEQTMADQGGMDEKLAHRHGELQTAFEHLGGYTLRARAEKTLSGLGFAESAFHQPFASFSGGWQMRAELARVLVAAPDVLLLDEPTNYLDVPAIEWLQGFLKQFPGTLLLISHDRYLLNILSQVTLEVAGCQATRYAGNYAYYEREREQRHEQLVSAKQNQDRKKEQLERFVERFKSKSTKASQAQSRMKALEKMEEITVPVQSVKVPAIRLAKPARCGAEVVRLEQAGLSYDGDVFVFRNLDLRIERGMKAAVIGLNGMGKTTLLRVLAGIRNPTEGRRVLGYNVEPGYLSQDFADTMPPDRTVFETARQSSSTASEAEIRSLLGSFRFSGDAVDKKVEVLSGGEKVRLALARLLLACPNFLLLDEPTTHLDIPSREALEQALRKYEGTLCLVSHDIEFIRHVATTVFDLQPTGLTRYYGDYDYFRAKRAQSAGAPAAEDPAATLAVIAEQTTDRKTQRREAAEKRRELSKRLKPLKETSARAEALIEKLEAEQAELMEKMVIPDVTADTIAACGRRLKELPGLIEKATRDWEQAEMELEKLSGHD
ncbi:MAG: ABC-F family ATP-binding cassette domain-containing protein [Lentisphaeria bacterium]|nr:ABC-F family ATP-binding cassette domain-containing protein [Lentisphaeria bacterium]